MDLPAIVRSQRRGQRRREGHPTGTQLLITCSCCGLKDADIKGALFFFSIFEFHHSLLLGNGFSVEWIQGACLNFLNLASKRSVMSTINFEIAISTSRLMRRYVESEYSSMIKLVVTSTSSLHC